jgi:SSS family solute:Na+ symporter
VFFQEHPDALAPLEKVDQILPWFVISQMPAGLAGLVIAGVFAAAMSSLDSSMHSIATSVVTDWWRPCRPGPDEVAWLRRARVITLVGGLFGTLTALVLAGLEIQFLWDFFWGLLGLIGGTLAGVMAVGVFCPRVGSCHVWPAIIASLGATVFLKFFSPIHSLLLGFVGVTTVMLVSVALSFLVRQRSKKNPHLRLPLS